MLHSQILGEGQPLLILHGFLGMSDNWKTLGKKYANHFQVHLIDQRNHGRSFHSDVFDYEHMVSDLKRYIEGHNLKEIYLLGHSMGGKTAMLFATEYPEMVAKLIVADISPRYYSAHHQNILDALTSVDFSIHNTRQKVTEQIAKYITEIGVQQFLLKNVYWKEKGMLDFRMNLSVLVENYDEVGVALPSLAIFSKETMFLKGEDSGYIGVEDEALIRKHFPKATVKSIANAGHWLHAENPKEFFRKTLSFLED